MAYRALRRKASVPLPVILLILALVIGAAVLLVLVFSTPKEQREGNASSEEPTASAMAPVTSETVSADDGIRRSVSYEGMGDIVFRAGEGYDLLSVVNKNYLIPSTDGDPALVTLTDEVTNREGGNYQVDARVAEPLAAFLAQARSLGYNAILWSAFRTYDYQNGLYERAIANYMEENHVDRAEAIANITDVAPPGTSEHCTGLAVDIYTWSAHSKYDKHLDTRFAQDPIAQWMKENAHKYGFILRYPEDKADITMITFEPWHFRYVGIEAATDIYEQGLTLEEYTAHLGE